MDSAVNCYAVVLHVESNIQKSKYGNTKCNKKFQDF